ncbi:hypothetical protein C8R45DRAFT_389538 [Mycena sanguinolenta]|nr:hypothetical protein C8R45DRAFT_389538 [Mycena sanguinolenta]
MASFDRNKWISCGKLWKDTPKSIRHLCHGDFKIPGAMASTILPADGISIHSLLDFTLLRASPIPPDSYDTSDHFSRYSADTVDSAMILRLRHLDMPPVKVIRRLVHEGPQAWLDGFTSVKYAHLPGDATTHLPLWVISFWKRAIDIRIDARTPWTHARDWVNKQVDHRRNPEIQKCATDVAKLLGILPWNGLKRGLSDTAPIHTLWRFLGTEWPSSTDENDMLEILRERIASDSHLAGCVRVEAVELTAKLTAAFEKRETVDYRQSRWLSTLGTDVFEHGERLVTIAHLGVHDRRKHWVAIHIDGPGRLLRYGDSFNNDIPPTLRQAYEWWASQHISDLLQFDALPTSNQTDGHSCGILSGNAAERAVYPEIPAMEQSNIGLERLRMFSKIANRILDRIADEEVDFGPPDDESSNSEPEEVPGSLVKSAPPSFADVAQFSQLTFVPPLDSADKNRKRPKNHPNAPTPAASPEKKRVRERSRERSPPPPLVFDTLPNTTIEFQRPELVSSVSSDVFGDIKRNDAKEQGSKQTKLGSFFKVATHAEKDEMFA